MARQPHAWKTVMEIGEPGWTRRETTFRPDRLPGPCSPTGRDPRSWIVRCPTDPGVRGRTGATWSHGGRQGGRSGENWQGDRDAGAGPFFSDGPGWWVRANPGNGPPATVPPPMATPAESWPVITGQYIQSQRPLGGFRPPPPEPECGEPPSDPPSRSGAVGAGPQSTPGGGGLDYLPFPTLTPGAPLLRPVGWKPGQRCPSRSPLEAALAAGIRRLHRPRVRRGPVRADTGSGPGPLR